MVGMGCGLFGHGMGNIAGDRAIKNNPKIKEQLEIEKQDERNIIITARSKAKAYDIMVYVFGAIMIAFALMSVSLAAVIMLVCAYLFVVISAVFYRSKFEKEI